MAEFDNKKHEPVKMCSARKNERIMSRVEEVLQRS